MTHQWIPDRDEDYPADGRIRWCWLQLGHAAIMLQEFLPQHRPKQTLGAGASVSFMCEDALALYREFKARGVQTRKRPFVGNRLWVVPLTDPDGYRLEFASPTDTPEQTEFIGRSCQEIRTADFSRPRVCHRPASDWDSECNGYDGPRRTGYRFQRVRSERKMPARTCRISTTKREHSVTRLDLLSWPSF